MQILTRLLHQHLVVTGRQIVLIEIAVKPLAPDLAIGRLAFIR